MAQSETPKLASYKRIILCVDGTWLASDIGDKAVATNAALIARAISSTGTDADGQIVNQIVSYHSGLGSGDLPFQKAIYGGIGWGLDHDVCQVYEFIADNYEPGDEIFFFGFSRGAFTVRSVAGLVCDVGVLSSVDMSRFAEMYSAYRANTGGEPFKSTVWYKDNEESLKLGREVRVKVVGVWETVGALGIPEWPFVQTLEKMGIAINGRYAFHNTRLSKGIDYAFQALGIDEQRITFPPAIWHRATGSPAKDLQQCWFPGVHSNIGGQADEIQSAGDRGEIGNITFAWMVDNLSGMLTFEENAINSIVEQHQRALNSNRIPNGWGCGPIVSNFSGLQGAFFRLLGQQDRTPGEYPRDPGDGVDGATNEYFHPTVRIRRDKVKSWFPKPIQGWDLKEPHGEIGWTWEKQGLQAIPEYAIRAENMSLSYEEGGTVRYKVAKPLSRVLCPRDIMLDLDRDSKVSSQQLLDS